MSTDALMSTLDEAKPVHARWSEVNRQFLEFVETNPECLDRARYTSVDAHAGAVPHEVVWGRFVFGEHFGGVHLTMLPAGHGTGVVNPNQGAEVGAGLALVD